MSVDVLKKEKEKSEAIYRPTSFRSPWMFYATRAVLLSFGVKIKNLTRENKDRRETKIQYHTLESACEWSWRSFTSVLFWEMRRMDIILIITIVTFFFVISSVRSHEITQTQNLSPRDILENDVVSVPLADDIRSSSSPLLPQPLMIPLTLIHGADSKGAGFSLTLITQYM
jgi:hypothetical protein